MGKAVWFGWEVTGVVDGLSYRLKEDQMIRVSMREAKTGLPDLAERARAGERVVIERDGTP
jgi:hypothetical protein